MPPIDLHAARQPGRRIDSITAVPAQKTGAVIRALLGSMCWLVIDRSRVPVLFELLGGLRLIPFDAAGSSWSRRVHAPMLEASWKRLPVLRRRGGGSRVRQCRGAGCTGFARPPVPVVALVAGARGNRDSPSAATIAIEPASVTGGLGVCAGSLAPGPRPAAACFSVD